MDSLEKNKLHHDFVNSTVVIKCMAEAAANFVKKYTNSLLTAHDSSINQNQIDAFYKSMEIIQGEINKIETLFKKIS